MNRFYSRSILLAFSSIIFVPALQLSAQVSEPVKDPRRVGQSARMEHWRSLRYGLFIHWGPYSKLGGTYNGTAYRSNTEWIMGAAEISKAEYRKIAADLDPKDFSAADLVHLAKDVGFRYIIMTAKHYDGFSMFDSAVSDFDAADVFSSKRDLIKEFSKACEDAKMSFGFSYSIHRDWYHPGGDIFRDAWDPSQRGSTEKYISEVALPQVQELTKNYGNVSIMMFDNRAPLAPDIAKRFAEAVGPSIVTSREFLNTNRADYIYTDGSPIGANHVQRDWEQSRSLHDSWGYRLPPAEWQNAEGILKELVLTATRGGNYLLNVGLDGNGKIPPEAEERLNYVGQWLRRHGESIYGTSKTPFASHSWNGGATLGKVSEDGCHLYLHLFEKPSGKIFLQDLITRPSEAAVMATGEAVSIEGHPGAWTLDISKAQFARPVEVVKVKLPSMPVFGLGPITADENGNYVLPAGSAKTSGGETRMGRTQSSSDLRITGFTNEENTATWSIHVKESGTFKLVLESLEETHPDKKIVISLNGKEGNRFALDNQSYENTLGKNRQFVSGAILLKAGSHDITLSGVTDPDISSPITVARATLIKF